MTPTRKPTLCYTLDVQNEGQYSFLNMRIFNANKEHIQSLIEGTIENKAGYGSPEAAESMGLWFLTLQREGHRVLFDPADPWTGGMSISIQWQHYTSSEGEASYCDPRFMDVGRNYGDIQKTAAFLKKVAKKSSLQHHGGELGHWMFRDPADVIDALEAMRARRVVLFKKERDFRYKSAFLLDPEPRMWLLSDTLWKTFEIFS